jgi:hypothetical protein
MRRQVRLALLLLDPWRRLYSVLPNTLGSTFVGKRTREATPVSKVAVLCLLPWSAPQTAFDCEARKRGVGLLPDGAPRLPDSGS